MTTVTSGVRVHRAGSLDEALELLSGADGAVPLAGGTWIMRAPLRGEPLERPYVALAGVPELASADAGTERTELGALATHAWLAGLELPPALAGLRRAAGRSAFPAIRSVATLGGNIAARGFAEADLVPALLAGDATLRLRTPQGTERLALADYLAARHTRPAAELILGVSVPSEPGRRSAFERLTVRGGGEYAVASVAVTVEIADGAVRSARVAVGSVEERPRLCAEAGAALVGQPLTEAAAESAGRAAADECRGRDSVDAPGWYRTAVLPALMRRAVSQITEGS